MIRIFVLGILGPGALVAALCVSGCGGGAQADVVATTPSGGIVRGPSDPAADSVYATYLVYQTAPPVDDIESYPSVIYDGVTVYYVGGGWYRHDEHGWGTYRQEPPELARQREAHAREPGWVHTGPEAPPRVDHTTTAAPAEPRQQDVAPARVERPQVEPRMEAPRVTPPRERPVRMAPPPRDNTPRH